MPTGVSGIKWFPDSRRVAFISWVWPDAIGYKALEARYREHKDSKVKAHVVEHEAYRYWDHWLSDGRVPRLFIVDVRTQRITDLFAGTPYELPCADPGASHYDISPDGREIAFTFDPAEEKRLDHEHHIVALDLRAKRFRTLTKGSRLDHESPAYSPDGKSIAILTRNLRRSSLAETRIALFDRQQGQARGATRLPGTAACTRRWHGRGIPRPSSSWRRTARASTPFAGAWARRRPRSRRWAARSPTSRWRATRSRTCATP